jgi:cytoplasmic iron level regulating protein YaaA (DUF328/UPF0246 family)
MLLVLSPAKSLDFETPVHGVRPTTPPFLDRSEELIRLLKTKTPRQIADLMALSAPLSALNSDRYGVWSPRHTAKNSKPAVLAFNGDVYDGLDAKALTAIDLAWAQAHVAILSGLYGVLRPLDRIQPYRLEMGTRLTNEQGADLYAYWGDAIANRLNDLLAGERQPIVVNLASQEYFRAVDRSALSARVIDCVFEDWKDGRYKIISFYAKRARGLMARHVIKARARSPKALETFDLDGYAFDAAASEPDRLTFRRRLANPAKSAR